jgi:hypothetical protein
VAGGGLRALIGTSARSCMAERKYVYVDGESHFIRSQDAWRKLKGDFACLEQLRYVGQTDDQLILVDSAAKVFWTRRMNPDAERAYYFTSTVGDVPGLHRIKVALRNFGLEPSVILERRQLAKQRENVLQTQYLIEKPKGVDIALAVRVMEDSHSHFAAKKHGNNAIYAVSARFG